MKHKIFIYGTLRLGFSNHDYLQSSTFIYTGRTINKYALYVAGIPFVIKNYPVSHISGELYEINDETLEKIDYLEGHPSFYRRIQVPIITNGDEQCVTAWLYFYPEKRGALLNQKIMLDEILSVSPQQSPIF